MYASRTSTSPTWSPTPTGHDGSRSTMPPVPGDGRGSRGYATEVESTILQTVKAAARPVTSQTGSFWGRIQIRGTTIEHRAYTLPDGTINVGIYYVP